jgi:hypothetical protein
VAGEVLLLLGIDQRVEDAPGELFAYGEVGGELDGQRTQFVEQLVAAGEVLLLLGIDQRVDEARCKKRRDIGLARCPRFTRPVEYSLNVNRSLAQQAGRRITQSFKPTY